MLWRRKYSWTSLAFQLKLSRLTMPKFFIFFCLRPFFFCIPRHDVAFACLRCKIVLVSQKSLKLSYQQRRSDPCRMPISIKWLNRRKSDENEQKLIIKKIREKFSVNVLEIFIISKIPFAIVVVDNLSEFELRKLKFPLFPSFHLAVVCILPEMRKRLKYAK